MKNILTSFNNIAFNIITVFMMIFQPIILLIIHDYINKSTIYSNYENNFFFCSKLCSISTPEIFEPRTRPPRRTATRAARPAAKNLHRKVGRPNQRRMTKFAIMPIRCHVRFVEN
ncbi:hypothetical protein BpHYR1_016184 [Brachionus plicatilis]|uniref:Uncharacterized protein n=1 Tax=Brachionus plicatilis TaxID=10195 RepID=A0A3M7R4E1_BRAPC|nr:hypothetical protein BpHYR1_016184 [Brachionus plicatilis]